ncbi:hypothetical protein RFI_32302 [Reticulomyxa filosa]|uniref:Uncharacterized protein n=1 Tax=Reticulomyxa filosa TaxID=46433 RepID=X6LTX5_RETFI|nr:hypothetical protein RFI_32302 [Reticulomyxa filosa]|eukprot:ETO05094.1 hypothetical protein RFI_32302 [Reticulomyxa filosa]
MKIMEQNLSHHIQFFFIRNNHIYSFYIKNLQQKIEKTKTREFASVVFPSIANFFLIISQLIPFHFGMSQRETNTNVEDHVKVPGEWKPALSGIPQGLLPYIEAQLLEHIPYPYLSARAGFPKNIEKIIAVLEEQEKQSFLVIAFEIGNGLYGLLPKLHQERCVIDLTKAKADVQTKTNVTTDTTIASGDEKKESQAQQEQQKTNKDEESKIQSSTGELKIGKNLTKRSSKYSLTIDQAFIEVCTGCLKQHGMNWLYPPMQGMLYTLYLKGGKKEFHGVKIYSVELWDNQTGELVAGEIGSGVGGVYTSLTGFVAPDTIDETSDSPNKDTKKKRGKNSGCGVIQMVGLARLLQEKGFKLWDLGMLMSYKADLGSINLPRRQFVEIYRRWRDLQLIKLECPQKRNVKEIITRKTIGSTDSNDKNKQVTTADNSDVGASAILSKKNQKRLQRIQKRKEAKAKAKLDAAEKTKNQKHFLAKIRNQSRMKMKLKTYWKIQVKTNYYNNNLCC